MAQAGCLPAIQSFAQRCFRIKFGSTPALVCRGTISVLKARQRTAVSLTVEQHGGPTVFV
jgi:hypothetical protein